MLEGQGSTQPLMARGPTIEVLSAADAARRELRNGPPRFSGRGIRVGVWQHSGYGSAPILSALQGVEGVEAAPLYNLKPDSLSACQVVVLTQPREQVQRFKDEQAMAPVVAAIHRGVGVLVTHALVGVRGFVNLAPGISSGGAREVGSSWRVSGEHPIGRGLGGMVHRSTFGDRIGLVLGADGLLIAETPKGVPVVAAGRRGRGRYVACGLGIGIGSNDRDADVSEPETTLLINAVRWLAGGR